MFDGYIVDFQYSWNEALPNNLWSFFSFLLYY